jgi:hypothetical protein
MSTLEDRVANVVAELWEAINDLHRADFDEDSPQQLRPGATDADLQRVADLLGGPVPPSYAAFLRKHNGWLQYSGSSMLLPAGEHTEEWVQERLASLRELLEENDEADVLDNAFVVHLGPDCADFVVLKTDERHKNGELTVVQWDVEEGELGVFDSFLEFLEDELETILTGDDEE